MLSTAFLFSLFGLIAMPGTTYGYRILWRCIARIAATVVAAANRAIVVTFAGGFLRNRFTGHYTEKK